MSMAMNSGPNLSVPPASISIERVDNGWVAVGWKGGKRWSRVATTLTALQEIVDEWADATEPAPVQDDEVIF